MVVCGKVVCDLSELSCYSELRNYLGERRNVQIGQVTKLRLDKYLLFMSRNNCQIVKPKLMVMVTVKC